MSDMTPEALAELFHTTYERLAPEHGYETREASAVPWADVPERNKGLMVAVATEVLCELAPLVRLSSAGPRLHMMVGLPRSGKTTRALQLGFPVVSPDAIRLALHGHIFDKSREGEVWGHARLMVDSLFRVGHRDVVLDACSTTKARRDAWVRPGRTLVFHVVDTPASVCRGRAVATGRPELLPVIDRMAQKWDPPRAASGVSDVGER